MSERDPIECSIVITEADGNVSVRLQTPHGADDTIAAELAKLLFAHAQEMIDLALDAPDAPPHQ